MNDVHVYSDQALLVLVSLFRGWFSTWSSSPLVIERTVCVANSDKLNTKLEWYWWNLINIRYIPKCNIQFMYASDPIIQIRLHEIPSLTSSIDPHIHVHVYTWSLRRCEIKNSQPEYTVCLKQKPMGGLAK